MRICREKFLLREADVALGTACEVELRFDYLVRLLLSAASGKPVKRGVPGLAGRRLRSDGIHGRFGFGVRRFTRGSWLCAALGDVPCAARIYGWLSLPVVLSVCDSHLRVAALVARCPQCMR